MDELESVAIRECGMSGSHGILFRDLMEFVGQRCGNAISAPLQTLLWRRLRLLTCLEFSRDALDRVAQLLAEPRLEPGAPKGQPLRPLPRGEPIELHNLPERLEQVQEPQRLRLTANANTRMKETGWIAADSTQTVRVLELIACSREKGILQTTLSNESGLDAKSVFYYLKPLKAREMIDVTSVTMPPPAGQVPAALGPKHVKTNIIYLKRFAAAGDEAAPAHEGVTTLEDLAPIEARALLFLQEAAGCIAAETQVKRHAMALWLVAHTHVEKLCLKSKTNHVWERVRRTLQTRYFVQRVMLRADDGGVKREVSYDGEDLPQTQQQEVICLKLLDSAAAAAAQQNALPAPVLVAQVTMLEQMLRAIQRTGPSGILQAELHAALGIDHRVAYEIALQLVQFFGVQPSPENVGRQTQYRLTFIGPRSDADGWVGSAPGAALISLPSHSASAETGFVGGGIGKGVGKGAEKDGKGAGKGTGKVAGKGTGKGVARGWEEASGGGAGAAREEDEDGQRVLTREWVVRHESWDKGVPCTEQFLQRCNHILGRCLFFDVACETSEIRVALAM